MRTVPMRFSAPIKICLLFALVLLAGCHRGEGKKDAAEYLPVDKMYATAKQALEDGNLSKAIKFDERLIARFPFGPYTEQATLDLAYAQYKSNKREDAYSTINRFIKTYPAQKHVDYAYYLRGVINFDRDRGFLDRYANQDMTKRDQAHSLQSFEDFSDLLTRFPNSRYAADARQRTIYLRDNLARGEINIAEFYLRENAYVAAANRAKDVLAKYPRTPQTADALATLVIAYKKLGQDKLAADSERVLKLNFPNHPYLSGNWPKHPHWWWRMIPFRG
ncbi:MAG: outer membrane protein assembly factor BamD [Rudaea sp.]